MWINLMKYLRNVAIIVPVVVVGAIALATGRVFEWVLHVLNT